MLANFINAPRLLRAYFTLGIFSIIGPLLGIGSSLFGGSGGGGQGGGGMQGNTYVPTGLGTADQTWQGLLGAQNTQIGGQAGVLTPDLMRAYLNAQQNSGALGQEIAGPGGFASQLAGNAQTAFGDAGNLKAGGNALYQMGMDPQNALRDQLRHQTQDMANANTSMRGIGMSGEAAGIANQADTNFLNQWQNQQMQRAAEGLRGGVGAYDAAGRMSQLGNADLAGSLGFSRTAQQLPFDAANMYSGAMQQGVFGPESGVAGQVIPYLYQGMGAQGQAFGQGQTNLNNLTSGLGQAGNWLSSQFGSGGGFSPGNQTWGSSGLGGMGDYGANYG